MTSLSRKFPPHGNSGMSLQLLYTEILIMKLSDFCFGKHLGTLWDGVQKVTKRLFRLQEWLGCCSDMASTGNLEEETLSMKGPHFSSISMRFVQRVTIHCPPGHGNYPFQIFKICTCLPKYVRVLLRCRLGSNFLGPFVLRLLGIWYRYIS